MKINDIITGFKKMKWRYFLSLIFIALIFILSVLIVSEKNHFIKYVDIPTSFIVGLLPLLVMYILYGPSKAKKCFREPLSENPDEGILHEALAFFNMFHKLAWFSALLTTIVNVMEILLTFDISTKEVMEANRLYAALILLALLYSVLLDLAIIFPYNIMIRARLKKGGPEQG